ncbi:hypothetical protein [Cupriavidus oxalaticus]|uniref:hypothetical protein n=1 Tax=Cupriavidus oxalaticus TaxID=96344 RepID=UPI00403454E8
MELFSMPCGQIGSNGAIATGAKKESAARTLNFSDLKCPEGRCNVTVIRELHHSGKRKAPDAPTKKKPAEAG